MKVDAVDANLPKPSQGAVGNKYPDVKLRNWNIRRNESGSGPEAGTSCRPQALKQMSPESKVEEAAVGQGGTTDPAIPASSRSKDFKREAGGACDDPASSPWHHRFHFILFPICCVVILLAALLLMIFDLLVYLTCRRFSFQKIWDGYKPAGRREKLSRGVNTA